MNPTHTHVSTTFGTTAQPITSSTPTTSSSSATKSTITTTVTTTEATTVPHTLMTESIKLNPPLQADFFSSTTEQTDFITRNTLPPDRLSQDPAGLASSETGHHQIETILAGADHGLELVINLEKNEYLPGTTQIGAMVMLHSPDDFGISASEAIMVSPECATYIGLKMVRISRLPAPFPEQCIDVWPKGLQRKSMLNVSYSQQACIKICLQKTIQTRCKCQNLILDIFLKIVNIFFFCIIGRCQSAFLEQVEFIGTEFRICDTRKRSMIHFDTLK